jgi:hypothetical protein
VLEKLKLSSTGDLTYCALKHGLIDSQIAPLAGIRPARLQKVSGT